MNTITRQASFTQQVAHLILRYVAIKKRMIYGGLATVIGLLLITKLMLTFFPQSHQLFGPFMFSIFTVLVTYGGYAFSSTMFNELNAPSSATQFLTLPASTLEKLTAAWLVSYVAYTAVGVLAIYILSLMVGEDVSSASTMTGLSDFYIYTITQSIFLFGAAYFKANNFLSTLIAMIVVALGTSLLFIGLKAVFPSLSLFFSSRGTGWLISSSAVSAIFTVIISASFLSFTYLRLKNRQIA